MKISLRRAGHGPERRAPALRGAIGDDDVRAELELELEPCAPAAVRRDEEGLAVITVMIVVAIVLIYLAGNIRMLYSLERELKLVEKQQTHRLEAMAPAANSLSNTNHLPAQTNSPSK